MKLCFECSSQLDENANFCSNCGAKQIKVVQKNEGEYIKLDPDKTIDFFENVFKLFDISAGREIRIQKDRVTIGKKDIDFSIDNDAISDLHATFYFENSIWYLMDNNSKNGTWLNGVKLEPNKKYELFYNAEINFAQQKQYIFYKKEFKIQGSEVREKECIEVFEDSLKTVFKSNYEDQNALKYIAVGLTLVPLYFPTEMDLQAMFGNIDPRTLKKGDVISPAEDVRMRVLTLSIENEEFIPMFTSKEEVDKGPESSMTRMYPIDYIPLLLNSKKPIVINPFGETPINFKYQFISDIVSPLLNNQKNISENQPQEPEIGMVFDGKYEVLTCVGKGALSSVYLVKDKRLNKCWALKLFDKKQNNVDVAEKIFMSEFILHKDLEHPAIPRIVDLMNTDSYIGVVMEYVEGETLESLVKGNGAQPVEKVVQWGIQICDVIGYLHSLNPAHIYRDVKPANIILKPDGNISIIDFGIMRLYDSKLTEDETHLGTRGYASPEHFGGKGQTDARSDIYSIGVTLHRLLTGCDPTNSPLQPIRQINSALPKDLERIINKSIEMDRRNRYQTCRELASDLEKCLHRKSLGDLFKRERYNKQVEKLYSGMKAEIRDNIFYGGLKFADYTLTTISKEVFGNTENINIERVFQIYVQTWIRSKGSFDVQFSMPDYIEQALIRKFEMIPEKQVQQCVRNSLAIIYENEPELKQQVALLQNLKKNEEVNAQLNRTIEDLYVGDCEYGLCPNKPIFVAGFGKDKEYLSHLATSTGGKLCFERLGSQEVVGIAGPVDLYRLSTTDNRGYMNIYICNYGSRNTKDVPVGLIFVE